MNDVFCFVFKSNRCYIIYHNHCPVLFNHYYWLLLWQFFFLVLRSSALLEGGDAEITTIAICQCWCGQEFLSQADLEEHKRMRHEKNRLAQYCYSKFNFQLCLPVGYVNVLGVVLNCRCLIYTFT